MTSRFIATFSAIFFCFGNVFPQQLISSLKGPQYFNKDNLVISYYDSISHKIYISYQNGFDITRQLYDTSFNLLGEYSLTAGAITLSEKEKFIGSAFVSPLCTKKGVFEVYADKNEISIYKPDFNNKKDSLIEVINFSKNRKEDRILSFMPGEKDLKILLYNSKENLLNIFQWSPGQASTTISFSLPRSTLTNEEEKNYSNRCRIDFKKIEGLKADKLNKVNPFPVYDHILFTDTKIYLQLVLPFSAGIHVMELDLAEKNLRYKNYFINSVEINTGTIKNVKKSPVSTIFDSILVIQNSSHYRFEFYFYNLRTNELIKSYSVPVKDSIYTLVHSPLFQKGTYGSPDQEKELENETAFMRKINGSFSYMSTASYSKDSIVFTLASLQNTEGIEGTLLSFSTMPLGYMANIRFGNFQFIPYLTSTRNKLLYAHAKFDMQTFNASISRSVKTILDDILTYFNRREIGSNSTFLIQTSSSILISAFNKSTKLFDVYKFVNSN